MRFYLDTDDYESIKIEMSDKDGEVQDIIQEFCFAMASFFVDMANKLDCNTESAKSLQKVCSSCIERDINVILDNEVLNSDNEEEINDEQLSDLTKMMAEHGFSEDEINNIVEVVKSCGSMESAIDYLKEIGEEAGIDWDNEDL